MRKVSGALVCVGAVALVVGLGAGLTLGSGCGGDEGGGDGSGGSGGGAGGAGGTVSVPEAVLTVQERLEIADFEAEAAADADLAAAAADLTIVHAGVVEDSDGKTVTWGEGPDASGTIKTAVRACEGDSCSVAVQTRSQDALSWSAGSPMSLGRPVLLKELEGHELANKTTLSAGIDTYEAAIELDKAALPGIDFNSRRFVAFNTFGDVFGTRLSQVTGAAKAHGGYDEVVEIQYVREDEIAAALRDLDYLDTVVWLAQGVREEVKSGGREYRTVGLTVNRGGYGETMMTRDDLSEIWDENVAGGPGLIVLAASNSYSDGTTPQPDNGSVWHRLSGTARILVGVQGHADVAQILTGTAAFVDAFLSGDKTLQESLDAGNEALEGSDARFITNAQDTSQRHLESYDALWDQAPFAPSATKINVPIYALPLCDGSMGDEGFATAWAEITFGGAYFEGRRAPDQLPYVDTNIRGIVTGFDVGDHVYIEAYGGMDKEQYQDFHVFGEGTIKEVETTDEGVYIMRFDGPAHAAPYTNDQGQTCILNNPVLQTTTSQLATLELTP